MKEHASLIVVCLKTQKILQQAVCVSLTNPVNITWGLIWDPQNLEDSHNMESFIDSTFKCLDNETDIELEISKLILEQDRVKWPEIPRFDEIDQEISKLIQEFQEEERKQNESGKPSISSCASPLMSFLSEVSDKDLASASRDIKLGCPDIEKCIDKEDLNSEELDRDNLDNDRDKLEIVDSSQYSGLANKLDQFAQLQGPSHNMTQGKTEGAPLPLLKLHISLYF